MSRKIFYRSNPLEIKENLSYNISIKNFFKNFENLSDVLTFPIVL